MHEGNTFSLSSLAWLGGLTLLKKQKDLNPSHTLAVTFSGWHIYTVEVTNSETSKESDSKKLMVQNVRKYTEPAVGPNSCELKVSANEAPLEQADFHPSAKPLDQFSIQLHTDL